MKLVDKKESKNTMKVVDVKLLDIFYRYTMKMFLLIFTVLVLAVTSTVLYFYYGGDAVSFFGDMAVNLWIVFLVTFIIAIVMNNLEKKKHNELEMLKHKMQTDDSLFKDV